MATAEQIHEEIRKKLANTFRSLPPILGEEVVNFAQNSFDQEAWSGHSQEVWPKRKNPTKWGKKDDTSRNLLVKSGALRRSIRVSRTEGPRFWVSAGGTGINYARVHNEGFRGPVKQHVKPFTRTVKGKKQKVKAHDRTIHQNIPQRRFIGGFQHSPYLAARLRRVALAELKHGLKS
ncbi:MAG: phage virion morphogenesis protein [Flavobacteriaceae bacterium]|nr:phage virion morphogenesis protein [Flavobacteriaceae bacterium]